MKDLAARILFGMKTSIPIFIWGPPGVGKSSMIQDITEDRGVELNKHTIPDAEFPKGIRYYLDGEECYASPDYLPKEGEGIFLIADFNLFIGGKERVAPDLFAYRRIVNRELGVGWRIVVTGIPPYEGSGLHPLQPHLVPLFCHLGKGCKVPFSDDDPVVDISNAADKESFRRHLHQRVKGFLLLKPEYEDKGRAILRTWSYLSTLLKDISFDREQLITVTEGLVGETAATEFLAFWDNGRPERG